MSIHEECGIFGLYAPEPVRAAGTVYYGLYALQHRGQESCGITVNDDGIFCTHKDLGLVGDVFSEEELDRFPMGAMAIGHVRYGTTGRNDRRNCQPLEVNHQKGHMALAHNGNLTNAAQLRDVLELSGAIFHTTSDTEIIAYIITGERLRTSSIEEAVSRAMYRIDGAYSMILMSPQKMIAVRDPYGFRPLCIGKTADGTWIAASESCALTAARAQWVRDVEPGEIVVFSKEGITSRREHCGTREKTLCAFEYIYFARPDSVIDSVPVSEARFRAGRILARTKPACADIVVGVPDSGLDAAAGFAEESGLPCRIGLVKNKYVGRTFIAPDGRDDKVHIKLAAVCAAVRGKRIVLIDDSIVRGTTSARIVSLLRDAGAREIHLRISSPPFLHPCYYGTDIDSEEHLIASHLSEEEIAKKVGADSLGYLSPKDLPELAGSDRICRVCFDGQYPTQIPADTRNERFEQRLSER